MDNRTFYGKGWMLTSDPYAYIPDGYEKLLMFAESYNVIKIPLLAQDRRIYARRPGFDYWFPKRRLIEKRFFAFKI